MKVSLGCDHGGVELKNAIRGALESRGLEVTDHGTHDTDSVDYPDLARRVASDVASGTSEHGILVCRSGAGMSMAANKHAGVRAVLCISKTMAHLAREHNDANVMVLGGDLVDTEEGTAILDEWLSTPFSGEERHIRRLEKVEDLAGGSDALVTLEREDAPIYSAIREDEARQRDTINLIASENYTSPAIREAQGSVMTNKYAEGYPGRRWYHGCGPVDQAEQLAIDRAKALFGCDHANVQAHCGSSANMAVYFSALKPGDKILAMSLDHGGHLTHGHKLNFSGRLFEISAYGVDKETECIDYDALAAQAEAERPAMIVAGASAYSRVLDFPRLREIADAVGALLLADMAHIAGLVAAGVHPSPVPHCDFVTTTTHKTLRGPRGGLIMCRQQFAKRLDREVFPGIQGGPLMHTIAAKAVCFREAATDAFKTYQKQVVENAQAMAAVLEEYGVHIVSGGTDNHLMLVDLQAIGVTGQDGAEALQNAGIIVNKNAIPFDPNPPALASGIRIGTPAITSRGMDRAACETIARAIASVLKHIGNDEVQTRIGNEIRELSARYPVP